MGSKDEDWEVDDTPSTHRRRAKRYVNGKLVEVKKIPRVYKGKRKKKRDEGVPR